MNGNLSLTPGCHDGRLVHAILGVGPRLQENSPGADSQDRMDQQTPLLIDLFGEEEVNLSLPSFSHSGHGGCGHGDDVPGDCVTWRCAMGLREERHHEHR